MVSTSKVEITKTYGLQGPEYEVVYTRQDEQGFTDMEVLKKPMKAENIKTLVNGWLE